MANSDRLYIDKNGEMFIPMNVEGGSWNENFMTTTKLISLTISSFIAVALIAWLRSNHASGVVYVIIMGMYLFIIQLVIRYVVFEEKLYYKMYKDLKESEITTPSIFWDIASVKETDEGALLTYADGNIGVIVKLERDTITGKNPEFKEEHYDAISNFYKEIVERKYMFVQMNIMEQAGNDPRLAELDKLTIKSDNKNINKLMEKQVGYIKNITNRTLYESDYILVYTKDLSKIDSIIGDTIESIYKLMDGAFIGLRVINSKDIIEFIKEEYGVKYFNYTEATLSMFKNHGIHTKKPFELSEIVFNTGKKVKIGVWELNYINTLTSGVLNGTIDINNISIKDAIVSNYGRENSEGIDFSSLSDIDVDIKDDKIKGAGGVFIKNKKYRLGIRKNKGVSKSNKLGIHSNDTVDNKRNNESEIIQQVNKNKIVDLDVFNDEGDNIDF